MGPLLMTGLACFGGAFAIGLIASSASRPAGPGVDPLAVRGLAIVLMAFAQGIAILGVVIGLLAIFEDEVPDPADGVLAVGPAVLGVIFGLAILVRDAGVADRGVRTIGTAFIAGLGMLGVVVAVLASVLGGGGTGPIAWPFSVLGTASAAAAVAIGLTGARAIGSMGGASPQAVAAIRAAQIVRSAVLQAVAVAASVLAILMIEIR